MVLEDSNLSHILEILHWVEEVCSLEARSLFLDFLLKSGRAEKSFG